MSLFLGFLLSRIRYISLACVRSLGSLQDGGVAQQASYVPLLFPVQMHFLPLLTDKEEEENFSERLEVSLGQLLSRL